MPERFDYPPQMSGTEEAQLNQLWSYLYQMAENLNISMASIGGNDLTDEERKALQPVIGTGTGGEHNYTEMESLKSLIIKTATFVQTKIQEYRTSLSEEVIASGQFGNYVRNTMLDVAVNPTGITQNYSFAEIVRGLKTFEINAKNYIKTGLLRTVSSIPVYGVAIGKDVVTFSEDGTETYNDGNKVAELTADELSFYQGGTKIASYKGNRISFYYGSDEAFYISNGKIYCTNDLELSSGKKLIIDTSNFKIDSSGNVTIKGTISAGSTYAGTMSAGCITSGTLDCSLITVSNLSAGSINSGTLNCSLITVSNLSAGSITSGTMDAARIKGGTLTLGGNNNTNGSLSVKNASGTVIGTWNKDGISISSGSISAGCINSGTLNCSNITVSNLSASSITSGTLNCSNITVSNLSASSITGGTMSAARISGGTLTLGGNNNASGTLSIKNASGTVIGKWDKDGISITSGSISAGCINSGTLNCSNITVSNLSAGSITGGTMDAARIKGGTLTLGGNNNTNGAISVKNASGTEIGKWNKDGISITSGSVKADCINTGTLNCTNITVSNFDAGWINTGKLSANYIEGGVLTLGGENNGNGVLMIKNASDSTIGQWDNSGLTMYGDMTIQSTGSMTFSGGDFTFQSGGTFTVSASNFTVDSSGKIIATGDWGMDEDGISLKTEYTSGGITRRSDFYIGYNPALSSTVQSLGYILPDVQYDIRNTRLAHNIIFGVKRYNDSSATEDLSITLGYQRPSSIILPDPASIGYLCLRPTTAGGASLGSDTYQWAEGHIDEIYGTLNTSSSIAVKENVQEIGEVGSILDRLEPVSFVYKGKNRKRYGLIYENTIDVFPDICTGQGEKAINYVDIVPLLIKEIQDLRQRVRRLEKTA